MPMKSKKVVYTPQKILHLEIKRNGIQVLVIAIAIAIVIVIVIVIVIITLPEPRQNTL